MPDFVLSCQRLNDGLITQVTAQRDGRPASYREVLDALSSNEAFQSDLTQTITSCGYQAIRFETPAATIDTLMQPFECVLVNSPGLDRAPDAESFIEQFEEHDPDLNVIVFSNLGGDATMIVPRPITGNDPYTHLLDFLINAPMHQVHELWSSIGSTMLDLVGNEPRWLNTAGGGVPWLHVRIDSRPKYYNYRPYTALP